MSKRHNQQPSEWRKEQARKREILQEQTAVARLNKAARLYDRLFNYREERYNERYDDYVTVYPYRVTGRFDETTGTVEPTHVIDATNVQNYLGYDFPSFEPETWELSAVKPPFSSMFIEYRDVCLNSDMGPLECDYGFHVSHHPYELTREDAEAGFSMYVFEGIRADAYDGEFIRLGYCVITLDEFGSIVKVTKPSLLHKGELYGNQLDRFLQGLWATLFTLQLMNCKNVQLIDTPPDPDISRKYEKRYGQPLVTVKTLLVTPMRKWRADAPAPDPNAATLPKSLHIQRGHFKDYRNGNGLFGKFRDIFWWDAHARGDEQRGVTVKDYEVEPL